jgi:hypothetical protein
LLLIEEGRLHAIGVTLHGQRPILEVRQQHRRDLDVIGEHLALGETGLGIIDLFQIGNRHGLAVHLQRCGALFRHGKKYARSV